MELSRNASYSESESEIKARERERSQRERERIQQSLHPPTDPAVVSLQQEHEEAVKKTQRLKAEHRRQRSIQAKLALPLMAK
jgi:hypothetical protein